MPKRPKPGGGPPTPGPTTEIEDAILDRMLRRGNGTAEQLRGCLADAGIAMDLADLEAAPRGLRRKHWVRRTDWVWHFSLAAIHSMR